MVYLTIDILFGHEINNSQDENLCRYLYYNQLDDNYKNITNDIIKSKEFIYDLIISIFIYHNLSKIELNNNNYLFYHYGSKKLFLINKHEEDIINNDYIGIQGYIFYRNMGSIDNNEKQKFEQTYYNYNLKYNIHNLTYISQQ